MAKMTICLASPKGGSGKTAIAYALGEILAHLNQRVLLVDSDAATNGLTLMHIDKVVEKKQNHAALSHSKESNNVIDSEPISIKPVVSGNVHIISKGLYQSNTQARHSMDNYVCISDNLWLLPTTYSLMNTEDVKESIVINNLNSLKKYSDAFDFVIIDAQAGSDKFAAISFSKSISDSVIIVAEYDPISAAGVERLKRLFPDDLDHDRVWILLNKVLPEYSSAFSEFLEIYRYLTPIPWDADVVRSYIKKKCFLDVNRMTNPTVALLDNVPKIFQDHVDDAYVAFKNMHKAASIGFTQERYIALTAELDVLKKYKRLLYKKSTSLLRLLVTTMALLLTVGITYFNIFAPDYSNTPLTDLFEYLLSIPTSIVITIIVMIWSLYIILTSRDKVGEIKKYIYRMFKMELPEQTEIDEVDRKIRIIERSLERLESSLYEKMYNEK